MADAGLPHFKNSQAAMKDWEPLYQNQFGVEFFFPTLLNQLQASEPTESGVDSVTLSQQVKKLSGLPEITPLSTVEQFYKFAKRTYAAAKPEDTTAEIEIDMEVNLNNAMEAYAYNMMRAWGNIIFDPLNGSMGLKSDYVGQLNVYIHNKRGQIYRKFEFPKAYLMDPINAMELDYQSDDLYTLTVKFKCDYWREEIVGINGATQTQNWINSLTDEIGESIG